MRQKKNKRKFQPLVVDICDEFSIFSNQSKKRLMFYNKCNYDITIYEMDGTNHKYEKVRKKREKKKDKIENIEECLL